jgi:hypothetical protein
MKFINDIWPLLVGLIFILAAAELSVYFGNR